MYRASEASEAEAWNDLPLGPCDLLIVKGKGRPKDSLGLGSRSHRRDLTLLDRALNQERYRRFHQHLQSGTESGVFNLRTLLSQMSLHNSSSTTTSKALKWLEVHGDTYEAGTQMPCASQRMAPLLEDPDPPFSLGDPGAGRPHRETSDISSGDSEGLAVASLKQDDVAIDVGH
ncbi:hypothetical protein E4U59_000988 [Claviceps monticola]|nr:hypothetical protein E4U59_000988 [Claviceps monticola]